MCAGAVVHEHDLVRKIDDMVCYALGGTTETYVETTTVWWRARLKLRAYPASACIDSELQWLGSMQLCAQLTNLSAEVRQGTKELRTANQLCCLIIMHKPAARFIVDMEAADGAVHWLYFELQHGQHAHDRQMTTADHEFVMIVLRI